MRKANIFCELLYRDYCKERSEDLNLDQFEYLLGSLPSLMFEMKNQLFDPENFACKISTMFHMENIEGMEFADQLKDEILYLIDHLEMWEEKFLKTLAVNLKFLTS